MSEFTDHSKRRSTELTNYMLGLIAGEDGTQLIEKFHILTENYIPSDVLPVFDYLYEAGIETEKIKTASNKLFNILYKTFNHYPPANIRKYGYLYYLKEDNIRISRFLKEIGNGIKALNKQANGDLKQSLISQFEHLAKIDRHYRSKENILFPQIEKRWENSACLKLMWSFHNDIRTNIKLCIDLLKQEEFDLQAFNRISAKVFFNIKTIIFREEKVLFGILAETFEPEEFEQMLYENAEIGFSYIQSGSVEFPIEVKRKKDNTSGLELSTGNLSIEQLELIFRHLPVDITFVDRNDEVRFYSDPPHRIFTRTKSIIGRTVSNCHPSESVDVVMKIIDAFKQGKKDHASFWITMKDKRILIRYFAVRNERNEYEGTLEVSQEIAEIQSLVGEKRLLEWDDLD